LKSSKKSYMLGICLFAHTLVLLIVTPLVFLSFANIFHPTQTDINKNVVSIVTKSFTFIEIINEERTKTCIEETCADDRANKSVYSASGVVIDKDKVLTAGHVCNSYNEASVVLKKEIVKNEYGAMSIETQNTILIVITDVLGQKLPAKILAIDNKSDLCILSVPGITNNPIKISASMPEIGDHALTAAAPIGIFSRDMTLVFDGIYSGAFGDSDVYTIPCRHGSSGAPIVNEQGELIGITYAASENIENVNIATNLVRIRDFLHLDK
jgi:S1-C subfamily serine protease